MSDEYETIASDGLEAADSDTEHRLGDAWPDPDVSLCPVIPLGFVSGKVVFAMPEGEIRYELASKVGSMLRTDIFACQAGQSFLTSWRDRDGKFQRDMATVWFVRKCREAGLWNDKRPVRGLGVWPGEAGAVILHKGDEVVSISPGGKVAKTSIAEALRVRSGPIYRLRPTAPTPAKAATVADGEWLREHLNNWRFDPIGFDGLTGADVVAGWIMGAILGAVPSFRTHVLMDAMPGSGKTTLMMFVAAVLAGLEVEVIDSFSPAGLRNDLAGQAKPVLIDEAESSSGGQHGPGPVEQALDLLRRMATGTGGTRKQGDVGGGSVTQTAVGAVMMAAVSPPKLGPADVSRIVELSLKPLVTSPPRPLASAAELEAAQERAAALAPAFLGRALRGAARYRSDFAEVKSALGRMRESPRTADLVAMLAAGRRLLLCDDPLTPDDADAEAAFWQPLLVQRETFDTISNTGADCLSHLFAADSGLHVRDRRQSIGDLIIRWVRREREHDDVLKGLGLVILEGGQEWSVKRGPWLLVANVHPALDKIFERSKWPDWRKALSHLDALGPEYAVYHPKSPRWFGLKKARATAIPLTPWLGGFAPGGTPGGETVPDDVPEEDLVWT